ncbi:MAG TPA: preprotein translocase subunit YajC [Pseudonocardiaceae bacterium]|jgi:preprotein translocase subunit YajC|nr:preprotein translocase subunit YajC [Pseudonocardiaceae bacterium]
MNLSSLLLPLIIVLFAIPLFMGTRKQKRAQQKQQELQNSLSYGDRVMTTSGLYGTVVATSDESIDIEISPGVVTSWLRAAVREKVADSTVGLPDDTYHDSDSEDEVEETTVDTASSNGHVVDGPAEDAVPTESGAQVAPPLEESSKKAR